MGKFTQLDFKPFQALSGKHSQTILAAFTPVGKEPSSVRMLVDIGEGDQLACEVSTPPWWKTHDKTIVLLHGLGGSHTSRYMIRMSRKLSDKGIRVVRINLRNCGSGVGLSKLPYGAGNSVEILKVVQKLKNETPESDIILIGFSLGGNTALKLAGELCDQASKYIKMFISVCPPLELEQTVLAIQSYPIYHYYYLNRLLEQAKPWVKQKIHSLYEYDDKINGPLWGFKGAKDYYEHGSSKNYINQIGCETHLLFAEDDPFVSMEILNELNLPDDVHVWSTKYGGHMGFLGPIKDSSDYHWMDQLILNWVDEKF